MHDSRYSYNKLFIWIYFTITGLFLLKGVVRNSQFPKVIISDKQLPLFSFYPYAVIPADQYKNGNYDDILEHEFAHIRQGHTFDLLLGELFIAFQWFNPFVRLIKRSILLNHEYLADHVWISNNKSAKEYKIPVLPQVVIAWYKASEGPNDLRSGNTTGNGLVALQNDCVRFAGKLGEISIPEWKEKNMDFALTFKFILK
jgi:hypothetical protein